MDIEYRGKNVEIAPALRSYAEKKLAKLDRLVEPVKPAQLVLSVEGENQVIEVTIPLSRFILRAEESQLDMYSAVDMVVDKLERQLKKHKAKLYKRYRQVGLKAGISESISEQEKTKEPDPFPIVKTKRFALKPMDEEEAIMQMNLLGHDFFVFFNADSEDVNVVYKRKDGNYGLIEPEF